MITMSPDNKNQWSKNCPKCGKEEVYTSKYTLQNSIFHNKWCNKCRSESKRIEVSTEGWVKKCPSCGNGQRYTCKSALTTAIKQNCLCHDCGALKNKIIPEKGI